MTLNKSKKEIIFQISHNIRYKIRDVKTNIAIIEAIQLYYPRQKENIFAKHLMDIAWSLNWSMLIINMCTIFEWKKAAKDNEAVCSLNEIWKFVDSYKRLSKDQKRRKSQLIEYRRNFKGFYVRILKENQSVRNKCIAHNDYFRKKKYTVAKLEDQKQLIEYAEHFLSIVGEFMSIRTAPLSTSYKIERCLYEILSK